MRSTLVFSLSMLATASLLVACGGSDSSVAPTSTTITGSAVKGPVNGATVTIKKASDGTVVGTTTTGAGGSYTVSVPYQGDVIIEVSGGTYTDEATGITTSLTSPMKSVLSVSGTSVTGVVTPLTTMAFTTSFPSGTGVTAAAFKTAADNLATQFQLSGVDLTTTTPVVTGTTNAYGNALKAVSQYLKDNNTTLGAITNQTLTQAQWTDFSTKYSASYKTATGQTVTYNIAGGTITTSVTNPDGGTTTVTSDAGGTTVTGSGAGGGSGTCGVSTQGSVSVSGFTVPINFDYCVSGLQGSCDAGNTSLAQQMQTAASSSASLPAGVSANISYSYSATCKTGAYPIVFK